MAAPQSSDVIVVGGGLAGMVTATRAAELGLRATVLERGVDTDYLCNSRITSGVFHVASNNILLDPAELRQTLDKVTRGHCNPDLADALAGNARRAVEWLSRQGATFIKGPTPDRACFLLQA